MLNALKETEMRALKKAGKKEIKEDDYDEDGDDDSDEEEESEEDEDEDDDQSEGEQEDEELAGMDEHAEGELTRVGEESKNGEEEHKR